jgi:hypothetical protein
VTTFAGTLRPCLHIDQAPESVKKTSQTDWVLIQTFVILEQQLNWFLYAMANLGLMIYPNNDIECVLLFFYVFNVYLYGSTMS